MIAVVNTMITICEHTGQQTGKDNLYRDSRHDLTLGTTCNQKCNDSAIFTELNVNGTDVKTSPLLKNLKIVAIKDSDRRGAKNKAISIHNGEESPETLNDLNPVKC